MGVREIVETESEDWKESSAVRYLPPPRTSPGAHDSFAGTYAYLHTEDVRKFAPSEYKYLVHPIILVKDGSDGKLTDLYILDNLQLRQ